MEARLAVFLTGRLNARVSASGFEGFHASVYWKLKHQREGNVQKLSQDYLVGKIARSSAVLPCHCLSVYDFATDYFRNEPAVLPLQALPSTMLSDTCLRPCHGLSDWALA